ncbi:TrpR like protein, YerC/YecD [Candidatus Dojkabacteria bacterium]|nr:TrpR like protein, YerC/YecD [Candidatus Dojkabacteria bacterium]
MCKKTNQFQITDMSGNIAKKKPQRFKKPLKELLEAFLECKNKKELYEFCFDLMTEAELRAFVGRFQAAKWLYIGFPQRKVSERTGVSIATVTRVNKFLSRPQSGYFKVITKLSSHPHT